MRKVTKKLTKILENHKIWLNYPLGGKQADLRNVNLQYADLSGADLRCAKL